MPSGKKAKAARKAKPLRVSSRQTPWGTIAAVTALVVFAGAVFGYAIVKIQDENDREAALTAYTPSESNQDPSTKIAGVVRKEYTSQQHITPDERTAYDQSPPFGGPHDASWAVCTGVVYPKAIRSENAVHALEHGAVWVTYNPAQVSGPALEQLKAKVDGIPYTFMSPYPTLDKPVSLQSWGHQLKLDDPQDVRIDQFIQSLRQNDYTYPETGATCSAAPGSTFDQDNPPPFNPTPPRIGAKGTVTMDGKGAQLATDEMPQAGSGQQSSP